MSLIGEVEGWRRRKTAQKAYFDAMARAKKTASDRQRIERENAMAYQRYVTGLQPGISEFQSRYGTSATMPSDYLKQRYGEFKPQDVPAAYTVGADILEAYQNSLYRTRPGQNRYGEYTSGSPRQASRQIGVSIP